MESQITSLLSQDSQEISVCLMMTAIKTHSATIAFAFQSLLLDRVAMDRVLDPAQLELIASIIFAKILFLLALLVQHQQINLADF